MTLYGSSMLKRSACSRTSLMITYQVLNIDLLSLEFDLKKQNFYVKVASASKHDSHIFKFDRRNLDLRLRITMEALEGKIPRIHGVIYKDINTEKVDSVFYEQDHSYKLFGEQNIRYIYVHIVFEEEAKVKLVFFARTRPCKEIKSSKRHYVDLPESMSMQQC